jgi:hypothetical protein
VDVQDSAEVVNVSAFGQDRRMTEIEIRDAPPEVVERLIEQAGARELELNDYLLELLASIAKD